MKVFFVAVFDPSSTNYSQAKGFEKNGVEVIRYEYRQIAKDLGVRGRDDDLIKQISLEKPDVILFSKCNDVDIRVVKEANKVGKTVLWYMDPLNSNFNEALRAKVKECDYTFCALRIPYNEACKLSDSVYFLQEGFDEEANFPMEIPKIHEVSFIGNLRNERAKYHKEIGFTVITDAYGEKHSEAVSKSRINLNFTEGGTSDRTYKVLASGGFLLTERWPQMEDDFEDGKDFDTFSGVEELKKKIAYYLEHEEERKAIAFHGHMTVQKFNRTNWAKEILGVCNEV